MCVLPFPDGDARKDTKIYPGSGKRRPYVQQGGRSFYYLAPKFLYRGEYKCGMDGDGVWFLFYVCLAYSGSLLSFPFYSSKGRPRLHA